METGLRSRAALVGGASQGLGKAVATALAAEGCRLALWSRGGAGLDATAEELRQQYGVDVHTITADARDPNATSLVASAAREALGRVDVLVLNSGGPPTVDPTATDAEGWRQALQLLLITPVMLATELLPAMREEGWGRIVAILSSGVRQPIENLVYSNAGRSALAAWLKTTSTAVARDGVTINGVMPGRLDTGRVASLDRIAAERQGITPEEARKAGEASIPIGRYGSPAELASLVAYLCSEPAGYQTGTLVAVDGGLIRGI